MPIKIMLNKRQREKGSKNNMKLRKNGYRKKKEKSCCQYFSCQ